MAKKEQVISDKPITSEEFKELVECKKSPFKFAQFIKVIHPIRGKVPFNLYPFQKSVLWCFLTNRFNIILKFRQAGVTELISLYCLWLAMYQPNKNIIIVSIKDTVAKKVLRKIKFMYRNLPDHLKAPIINGRGKEIGTSSELEFANGSIIASIPTTEQAARSEALSLLVIDEAAIVRWANQIWASSFPTLSTGGAAIVNSTPYGMGNWFHSMWVNAFSGGNNFNPIRLRWDMHPERDMNWYEEMRRSLGPRRTAQEIDGDFLTSGNSVFDLVEIRAIEDLIREHVYQKEDIRMNGTLFQHSQVNPRLRYYLGGDVSTGRARDYSTYTIFDQYGNEVECFKQKINTKKFSELLMKRGKYWNNALLAPEANSVGEAVVADIQDAGYANLYYSTKILRKKGNSRHEQVKTPGWNTQTKLRNIIINELEEDIRNNNITTKDQFFIQEAYTFIYDERNRPVAMGKDKRSSTGEGELADEGFSDDAILGKSIANFIRKGKDYGPLILPR